MPAAPTSAHISALRTADLVSLLPAPATTGISTASTTAAIISTCSPWVRVGDSPVVPARTRPSLPCSSNQLARVTAPSTSREPSSAKGLIIAVSTLPNLGSIRILSSLVSYGLCLAGPRNSEGGEEVLVQLEPDRVVRLDHRLGEPVMVSGHDTLQCAPEAPTVAVIAVK